MVQLARRSIVSLIGAIVGTISLFLPWVVVSASSGGLTAAEGISPAQLVAAFFSTESSSTPTDPAIVAWEQSAVLGSWLWLIGTAVLAIGCLVAVIQVFVHFRWAGIMMLVGSGLGGAGVASFSASFPTSSGVQVNIGPAYGVVIALAASSLCLLALFLKDVPLSLPMAAQPAVAYTPQSYYSYQPIAQVPPPAREPGAETPPTGTALPVSRFCPTCGQWYQQAYILCPRDGTELKPVQ